MITIKIGGATLRVPRNDLGLKRARKFLEGFFLPEDSNSSLAIAIGEAILWVPRNRSGLRIANIAMGISFREEEVKIR